jgi:hypothetical protein
MGSGLKLRRARQSEDRIISIAPPSAQVKQRRRQQHLKHSMDSQDAPRKKLFHRPLRLRGRYCTIFVDGAHTSIEGRIGNIMASGQDARLIFLSQEDLQAG